MGKELYEASPVFAAALDEACEAIDRHLSRPLKELLFSAEGSKQAELLDQTTFTQPALFALETALFRLAESLGLQPDFLAGHSVGEIVAAHVSGVLSLDDAARLICARAKLMGNLPQGGAMVAIEATEGELKEAIEGKEAEVSIAAINGPTAGVLSGTEQAVLAFAAQFEAEGKKTKRLGVSHAFHSPLMEPMLAEFQAEIEGLSFAAPRIPILSNLTGELLSDEQAQDPGYWASHVRNAVRFADSVAALDEKGTTTYLELGPEAVLTAMATSCLPEGAEVILIPTLRKGRDERASLNAARAQLHAAGAKLDWGVFFAGTGAKRVPLPTYPFQRERFWIDLAPAPAADLGAAGLGDIEHPLLAATVEDPSEGGLTPRRPAASPCPAPRLADHAVGDAVLLPATAFLELALRAAEQVGAKTVEELTQESPLIVPETGAVAIQVAVAAPATTRSPRDLDPLPPRRPQRKRARGSGTLHSDRHPGLRRSRRRPRAHGRLAPRGSRAHRGRRPLRATGRVRASPTARPSRGCARPGSTAIADLRRGPVRMRPSRAGPPNASPSTRRCWTRPCTSSSPQGAPSAGDARCPSAWRGVSVVAPGARELRVRIDLQAGPSPADRREQRDPGAAVTDYSPARSTVTAGQSQPQRRAARPRTGARAPCRSGGQRRSARGSRAPADRHPPRERGQTRRGRPSHRKDPGGDPGLDRRRDAGRLRLALITEGRDGSHGTSPDPAQRRSRA